MAPPLIDTSIVPKVPNILYALFDYGLTMLQRDMPLFLHQFTFI
ncbi:hypothetical protein [Ureibacillus sp. FSL W8-0352]